MSFEKSKILDAIEKTFEKNTKNVHKLTKRPDNEELLKLYGLFKQSTIGDNEKEKPYFYDIKACKKWDAWNSNKGLTRVTAMIQYNALCKELYNKYN